LLIYNICCQNPNKIYVDIVGCGRIPPINRLRGSAK
jgi:hypothetical protein